MKILTLAVSQHGIQTKFAVTALTRLPNEFTRHGE